MLHLPELQPVWCLPGCFKRNEEEKFADRVVILSGRNGLHQPFEKGTICSIRTCIKYGKIQKEGVQNGQNETTDCFFNGD